MPELSQQAFLSKYGLTKTDLAQAGIDWPQLNAIYKAHSARNASLYTAAAPVVAELNQAEYVHSVRMRVKDPEHLLEKIIRKKKERPERLITVDNYAQEITDLIGIRVLHLAKQDWEHIHDLITNLWDPHEDPIAYYRPGDSDSIISGFRAKGCKLEPHPAGYRSLHYVIRTQPTREVHLVEIQVRTIFEEGWSEIDHQLRYPYNMTDISLNQMLSLLNRIAGYADEMTTMLHTLHGEAKDRKLQFDDIMQRLNDTVRKLDTTRGQKQALEQQLAQLSQTSTSGFQSPKPLGYPWGDEEQDAVYTRSPTISSNAIQFSDVSPSTIYYEPIQALATRGILSGYSDGTFRPENDMTRGQFAKVLSNAAGFSEPVSGQTFQDVSTGNPFYTFIERLARRGIARGYQCGKVNEPCISPADKSYFRPNATILNADAAQMVSDALDIKLTRYEQMDQTFEDVISTHFAFPQIEGLALVGLLNGYPCGSSNREPCVAPNNRPYFRPTEPITRGGIATLIARAFILKF